MKNYVQDGDTINFTAAANLSSGAWVAIGKRTGAVMSDVTSGQVGVARMSGVVRGKKDNTVQIDQGQDVYLNGDQITNVAAGGTPAGTAWASAATAATEVDVSLGPTSTPAA